MRPTELTMLSAYGSYSTAYDSYYARFRAGYFASGSAISAPRWRFSATITTAKPASARISPASRSARCKFGVSRRIRVGSWVQGWILRNARNAGGLLTGKCDEPDRSYDARVRSRPNLSAPASRRHGRARNPLERPTSPRALRWAAWIFAARLHSRFSGSRWGSAPNSGSP